METAADAETESERDADDIVVVHDLRDRRRPMAERPFSDDPFVVDWAPPRS
jgi:hypothetical protein